MNLTTSKDIAPDRLHDLLFSYPYGRYTEDPELPKDGSLSLALDQTTALMRRKEIVLRAVWGDDGTLNGVILFHHSEWDSSHFGFDVAVIDALIVTPWGYDASFNTAYALLSEFDRWCAENRIRFASFRVASLDLPAINAVERLGYDYIESWISSALNLAKLTAPRPPFELRLSQAGDLPYLHAFSVGAFDRNRFHADHRISRQKADELYVKWIDSVFASPDKQILVYDFDGKPAALATFSYGDHRDHIAKRFVYIGLILVNPELRGQRIGKNFILACAHYWRDLGMDVVDSTYSLRNLPSMALHNSLNFKPTNCCVTFHKWYDRN